LTEAAVAPEAMTGPAGRSAAVDQVRGAAFLLMVVYHAAWDADFLGLLDFDLDTPAWRALRYVTLALFLGLVGVSLDLAAARGLRWRGVARRFALIAGAAVLVSMASVIFFPSGPITFGVLHCIAVASLIALPFLRLPTALVAVAGAVVLALGALHDPAFDSPWLNWLGFAVHPPVARDYVPLVPWFGVVLLGLALGRPLQRRLERAGAPPAGAGRALAFAGRNSLALYLAHQPVIYGLMLLAAAALGHSPTRTADFAGAFTQSCRQSCLAGNVSAGVCATRCDCILSAVRREFGWHDLQSATPSAAVRARLDALAQSCTESHIEGRDRR
jgi:uncharacterized membrane protein